MNSSKITEEINHNSIDIQTKNIDDDKYLLKMQNSKGNTNPTETNILEAIWTFGTDFGNSRPKKLIR